MKAAVNGMYLLFRYETHAALHFAALITVLVMGLICRLTALEWTAILLASGLVIVSEALNTGLEKLCDFVEPKHHADIGRVKDLAAGGVLCASIIALAIGCLIFIPYIKTWL